MRIAINIGGDPVGVPMSPPEVVDEAQRAEADGFTSAWTVHFSRSNDALSILAVAGTRTSTIEFGIGVVPTYPRHPLALAQQAATTQVFCGGRLTLGVGVSHKPVIEGLHGLSYTSPAAHMRDYLSVLVPLLRAGNVTYRGAYYQVDGGFVVPGTSPVSVVIAALAPKMVQVGGELSDGIVTWLAGPKTLEVAIVPGLNQAAAGAGRPAPRLIVALPVVVDDDVDAGRAVAETVFARYGGLDNYRRLLDREGVATPGALAVVGSEAEVEKQLRRYADLGVTEFWAVIPGVGDDARADSVSRTRALLAALAPEL